MQANSLKDLLQNKIDDMEKQVLSRVNTLEETKPVSRNDSEQRNRVESTLTSLHHRITDLEKGAFIFSGGKERDTEGAPWEFLMRLCDDFNCFQSARALQKSSRITHVERVRNVATVTLRTNLLREERRAALLCISQELLALRLR